LTLCNNSRTAALGTEVFGLDVFRKAITIESSPEEYKKVRLDAARLPLPLPLFEGAAQDLVLDYIHHELDAFHLLAALRAVFGANLRRIHLMELEEGWGPHMLRGRVLIPSTQTDRVYFFFKCFGHPLMGMQRVLKTGFHGLNAPGVGETKELGVEVKEGNEGDFDDQDAKVFEVPAWGRQCSGSPEGTLCFGEIIRQYGNGETRINKGARGGLKKHFNGWPSVEAKCSLLQVVRLAEKYFPKLEYVSFCGPISNPTLEAQLSKMSIG
jgi:hypothetical protein